MKRMRVYGWWWCLYQDIISVTKAGIHWSSLVVCPRFGGKNWKLSTKPCIPSSSSALVTEFSSTVLRRVNVDPLLDLLKSCSATRKIIETDLIMDGFDELAKISLTRSCMSDLRKLNNLTSLSIKG